MPAQVWTLTERDADLLVDCVREAARGAGISVAVAVVDRGGHLIALSHTDGTKPPASRVATLKAWTAAMFHRASGDYQSLTEPGGGAFGLWNAFPGQMVPVGGGIPVIWDDESCAGAVGVSGGSAAEDESFARQAVQRLRDRGQSG